ncbi:MAG: DNA polymerase III subunit delta' C-terminal domain-containing protein [Patescibacteria group bacterium]|mgnify:CR=1 FL=1
MKEEIKNLKKIIDSGQLGHAYLFYGASSEELLDFSLAFTKMLLGENINQGLDFLLLDKKDDKDIVIEKVRELIRFLALSSANSKYKVAIIKDAGSMNKSSANALLKVLEEPTQDKIIILTAVNIFTILPTILSRVQKIRLFTNSEKYCTMSDKEMRLFSLLAKSSITERLNVVEKIVKKDDIITLLESFSLFFHDMLYLKYNLSELALNKAHLEEIKEIADLYSKEKIQDILKKIIEISHLLKTTNVNQRLAIENLVINF